MFETVAPRPDKRNRWLSYETLPVSIALHALVIGGALVGAIWKVNFPFNSPRLTTAYSLTSLPDPPPPPPPPAPPKQQQQIQPQKIQVPVNLDVAPTEIPDVIPTVSQKPFISMAQAGVMGGVEGGVEGGVIGGSPEGVKGGEVGGEKGGTLGGVITDNRVHIERDKPLPMHPVSQVYPQYPEDARLRHYEDSLVVRYVIGTDGRVKEVIVISHAERKVFDESAVKAIRNWRFRPLIKDGQPTEVVHELTINFRIDPT